jgi:hypothetical protein
MSKRITLTDSDIELILQSMVILQEKSDSLPNIYPEYGLAARQRFQQVKDKLKDQHRSRSVETLGVSGHGDVNSVAPPESKEKI